MVSILYGRFLAWRNALLKEQKKPRFFRMLAKVAGETKMWLYPFSCPVLH
jgi:hypothetical protein